MCFMAPGCAQRGERTRRLTIKAILFWSISLLRQKVLCGGSNLLLLKKRQWTLIMLLNFYLLSKKSLGSAKQAFTLVELLIVVMILGILTAVAVPVFSGSVGTAKSGVAANDIRNAAVVLSTSYSENYKKVAADLATTTASADQAAGRAALSAADTPSTLTYTVTGNPPTLTRTLTSTANGASCSVKISAQGKIVDVSGKIIDVTC
jgi:type IV pilus assembly protein PilA